MSSSLASCRASGFVHSTTFTFPGTSLPTGLVASNDFIAHQDQGPLNHQFSPSNVLTPGDSFLHLIVPGGQSDVPNSTVSSAEVNTDFNVLFASVCTYAILSSEPGVCNGLFFYHSDRQEADIEYLTNTTSESVIYNFPNNFTSASNGLQYTNQALDGVMDDSSKGYGALPENATTEVHEYRLDWLPDSTTFFVDGVQQAQLTGNVPTEEGQWVWNNWGNGDPAWTGTPPAQDAVLRIQKIVMYYNTSDSTGTSAATRPKGPGLVWFVFILSLLATIA